MSTLLRQTPGCQDGESLARVWQGRAGHTLRRAPRGVGGLIHHGLPDVSVFILGWENPNTCLISKGQREGPGANRRINSRITQEPSSGRIQQNKTLFFRFLNYANGQNDYTFSNA